METQKLFRSNYVARLAEVLTNSNGDNYLSDDFEYNKEAEIPNIEIKVKPSELILPKGSHLYNFENSKIIFESYPNLNPVQATDPRLWTYLTHITYWKYMKARRSIEIQPLNRRVDYILEHWFVQKSSAQALLRNGISLLWWVAYLTYDETRKDPYELTKEAFSMLDYTRDLLSGTQGRNRDFAHAILEYVIENKNLFEDYKESKIRFLMRKANRIAGYKVFPGLPRSEIKSLFDEYKHDIELTTDE